MRAMYIPIWGTLLIFANMPLTAESAEPGSRQFATRTPRYRIETSDVLEITFRFTPEFNQTVTVQPDGFITLHSAGEFKVAGMTMGEVTTAIIQQYSKILHDPVVTIVLKEFNKPAYLVGGEVARPGRFDLRGDVTLTDAITIAGGFSPSAKTGQVLLFRRASKDLVEVKTINLKDVFEKGQLKEDIQVQPGDSIYVSKSKMAKLERFMNVTKLGLYFNPLPLKF